MSKWCTCNGCGEGSLSSQTLVEPRHSLSSLLTPLVILIELTTGEWGRERNRVNK